MIGVLVWLSTGAFLALVITLRVGLLTATSLLRLKPAIFGVLFLVVLSDQFEALEGYNDPDDPLAVIPRVVKWAWFAALAASIPHRARLLSVPLLALAHLTAVGYIAGAAEILLFADGASRAAWLADKVTLCVGLGHAGWAQLGLDTTVFPGHVLADLLMSLAPWTVAAALLLLLFWCYALVRSATLNTVAAKPLEALVFRPLDLTGTSVAAAMWVGGALLAGPVGGFALAVSDLGRLVWLYHLVSTVIGLVQRRPFPGVLGVVAVGLLTVPAAAGATLGAAGALMASWGIRLGASAGPATGPAWLRGLTHLAAVGFAAVLYLVLRSADLSIENPQDDHERAVARHVQGQTVRAEDFASAERWCGRVRAKVCSLPQWRNAAHVRETAVGWEWVQIPSAGDWLPGLARVYVVGGERPALASHHALRSELDADEVRVRCCR
ncbi:MAG: hypothetical protein ACI9OJ_003653 [Myxococcota bacterium]|jgi:hypothetical protein